MGGQRPSDAETPALWFNPPDEGPGGRRALTRERVVAEALAMIAADGAQSHVAGASRGIPRAAARGRAVRPGSRLGLPPDLRLHPRPRRSRIARRAAPARHRDQ